MAFTSAPMLTVARAVAACLTAVPMAIAVGCGQPLVHLQLLAGRRDDGCGSVCPHLPRLGRQRLDRHRCHPRPVDGGFVTPLEGADITFGTADDSVRYGDDAGAGDQQSWATIKAHHGEDVITNVAVSQGNSMGTDVSAMLKNIKLNGETFDFTTAPANGQNGTNGTNGANGVNGNDGAAGPAGKDGVTTVVHVQGPVAGATMRNLHVRKIAGMKFVGAKATLRARAQGQRPHDQGRPARQVGRRVPRPHHRQVPGR